MKQLTLSTLIVIASAAASSAALAQDVAAGKTSFNKCLACHAVGEGAKNKVGPELNGLKGRKSGTAEGYSYTEANKNSGITWDEATFKEYIKDPKAKIPGTKMVFAGIKNEQEASDLWAFLAQYDKDGKTKPAPKPGLTRCRADECRTAPGATPPPASWPAARPAPQGPRARASITPTARNASSVTVCTASRSLAGSSRLSGAKRAYQRFVQSRRAARMPPAQCPAPADARRAPPPRSAIRSRLISRGGSPAATR